MPPVGSAAPPLRGLADSSNTLSDIMIAPSLFYPSRFAAVSRLIPALSAGAQQDLSSVPLRMTDVPVVTAARLKGHAADGYALLRQHIQIAPA